MWSFRRNIRLLLFVAVTSLALQNATIADDGSRPARGEDAGLMFAAFECSHLYLLAGDEKKSQLMFSLGYRTGTRVFDALSMGEFGLIDEMLFEPLALARSLSGPSTEFRIGRAFQSTHEDIHDQISTWHGNDRVGGAKGQIARANCDYLSNQ